MRVADDDDLTDDTLPKPGPTTDDRTGTTIGNYTLHERLGSGGMAAVYRAVHRGFEELVAVKLLDPRFGAQPEMLRRFLREAVVMREISARNNHVVRALDFGQTPGGEAYLVMDYLTGQDLQQLLKTVGPLPWSRVAPLALQLCDALATTHAHGIIHRDIKPSNCLLTDESGEQRLKLIDFGVAKDLDAASEQTDANVVLGTPAYLAPELLSGAAVPDVRTDIYALGATLYCLLTGRPPHVGRLHSVIARKQRTEVLVPASAARPTDLPKPPRLADALIIRALHVDPDRRFQSVMDFADEIRHSLEPTPGTHQLAGRQLGLRAAWLATITVSAAIVVAIGTATAPRPLPTPAPFSPGGVPLALAAPSPAPPLTPDVPTPTPVPTDSPAPPVPKDSLPAPPVTAAVQPTPAQPVPPDSLPTAPPSPTTQPVPTDSPPTSASAPPTTQPVPPDSPTSAPPITQPVPTDTPPQDPRTLRVRRILDKQREALRRECQGLAGGASRLRFTLTLARGAIEAVAAQPGTFRECVRSTLKDLPFGVDGQYEYSFPATRR